MKQVLAKKGKIIIDDIPSPILSDDGVLVKVMYSCISAGTELSCINESGISLIKKALEKPEKVKQSFQIMKNKGVNSVLNKVSSMNSGNQIGYSASGIVIALGKKVTDIKIGERVACAGAGFANHSECIYVPRNLIVKMPDNLSFEFASTVALGGIALQGVRRADVRIGEIVAVFGMGILGQLQVQILKAAGCIVIGIDIDDRRLNIARENGCDYTINSLKTNIVKKIEIVTEGYGVDTVLISASTTSNELLSQAFNVCKKKGRVVLVGTIGDKFNREEMYKKELDFVISCSYGPGRYDAKYENKGIDYPYAYVRWTENRNMKEYLRLISKGKIDIEPLIERIYRIDQAQKAYYELRNIRYKPLIVLIKYDEKFNGKIVNKTVYINKKIDKRKDKINAAVIGCGDFAKSIHLPNLKKLKKIYNIYAVVSRTGTNAKSIAQQYDAKYASTDFNEVLNDDNIDMIMICTRHNLHFQMSIEAMKKGKAVFVEKPMALNEKELDAVIKTIKETEVPYIVGYNRRFSKYAVETKRHLKNRTNPMIINYQMNAGYLPLDHWVYSEEGGGRIIGEACHIFDLFNYFTDSEIESITVENITPKTNYISARDNIVTTLKYRDGSLCTLTYTSIGNNQYSKELCEIYCDNKIIIIDDYKKIYGYGVEVKNISNNVWDKGHYEELIDFGKFIRGEKECSIPLWQLEQSGRISYEVEREIGK